MNNYFDITVGTLKDSYKKDTVSEVNNSTLYITYLDKLPRSKRHEMSQRHECLAMLITTESQTHQNMR